MPKSKRVSGKRKVVPKKTVPTAIPDRKRPIIKPAITEKIKKSVRLTKKQIVFTVLSVFFIIALITGIFVLKALPSPENLGSYDIQLATKVYDRNGELLYDIFADQNRTPVPLSEIPVYVRQATIAIEDKNFYKHQGINPIGGMLRAAVASITGRKLQGGSTITQQLVKSALLTPERSIVRKVKEIILAFWVEILYPKDKILELYLNQVPYGGTAWGIETAAQKYFGKTVKDLTLAEAALLAGLPQAPTLYSPTGARPEYATNRQHEVLRRMVEDGYISEEQSQLAKNQTLNYIQQRDIRAPHFVLFIKEQLVEKYGEAVVERGGLKVYTTLDLAIQEYAESSLSAELKNLSKYSVGNGAAIVTRPATGEIISMIGSSDYFATPSGSYNVTTALRQPGSSIKPINYAIGLEKKIVSPATMFLDIPTCFNTPGQPLYCPKNYDGSFHGPVQLRFALGNSYNIPAVKMLALNTVSDMVASASAFGLTTLKDPSKYGLSLTLGGGEVRMIDMATAFSVFANAGIKKEVFGIKKIVDKNGQTLFEKKDPNIDRDIPSQILIQGDRVVSPETSFLVSHILLDNNARAGAFGSNSKLVIPGHAVSVKTGTTDDLRDNWTIGYTPQYLVVTWVGNNDNSPMNRSLVSGVTGAAPIWNIIMSKVLEDKPDIWPKKPDSVIGAQICVTSGLRPPNNQEGADQGCQTRFEYFTEGTVPSNTENLKQTIHIDKTTGNIAGQENSGDIEFQEKSVVKDAFSTYCLDCPQVEGKAAIVR